MTTKTYRQTDKLSLTPAELTAREMKVLSTLKAAACPMKVKKMASSCFPGQRNKPGTYGTEKGGGTDRGYRCALNSLRRLVAAGFVAKADRGTYQAV